jgi:hypothetical protein
MRVHRASRGYEVRLRRGRLSHGRSDRLGSGTTFGAGAVASRFEQAAKIQTIVNRTTAKALGIDVPTTLLLRADEVIE